MNLYLVQIILKFIRMLFIAFISFFNITIYAERVNVAQNELINQDRYAVNQVVLKEEKPKVQQTKNVSIKKPTTNINTKKVTPVKKEIKPTPNTVVTKEAPKTVPKQSSILETFTGRLTGYGPDCAGCTGYGNLACKTREKKTHSLKNNGIYYTDKDFGKVRIIAAATSKFKCGTIVKITKQGKTPFTAVVLDTGGSMRKAWSQGTVWMDLAYSTEAMAGSDNLTGQNIKFEVQRYGW